MEFYGRGSVFYCWEIVESSLELENIRQYILSNIFKNIYNWSFYVFGVLFSLGIYGQHPLNV